MGLTPAVRSLMRCFWWPFLRLIISLTLTLCTIHTEVSQSRLKEFNTRILHSYFSCFRPLSHCRFQFPFILYLQTISLIPRGTLCFSLLWFFWIRSLKRDVLKIHYSGEFRYQHQRVNVILCCRLLVVVDPAAPTVTLLVISASVCCALRPSMWLWPLLLVWIWRCTSTLSFHHWGTSWSTVFPWALSSSAWSTIKRTSGGKGVRREYKNTPMHNL